MYKIITTCLILLITLFCVMSCTGSKENMNSSKKTSSKLSPLEEDYYLQFNGVEERLAQLMSGRFNCYSVRKKAIWRVNDGKDSIMAYAVPIGNPAKQGTWVYREIIMTHFPEQPAVQAFYKITQISPDSLSMQEYWPKSKKNDYIGIQHTKNRTFKEEDLGTNYCQHYVIKVGQTDFYAYTPNRCKRSRKKAINWVSSNLRFLPQHTRSESKQYGTEEFVPKDSTQFNHTILYFRRLVDK